MKHMLAGLTLLLATPAFAVTQDQALNQFEEVVFGFNENDQGGNRSGRITRWPHGPIKVFTGPYPNGVGEAQRPLLIDAITRISRSTGISIESVSSMEEMNIFVAIIPRWGFAQVTKVFTDRWVPQLNMNPNDGGSMCRGVVVGDDDFQNITALILLPEDAEDWIRERCAYEELFQAMGPKADACHYRPSIYCEKDTWERDPPWLRPTWADEMLLALLYDKRLKNGMTREEAMPIVRRILPEYWEKYGPGN